MTSSLREKTYEDHLLNLETVFRRLSERNLRVNPDKCKFFQERVEYCGHGISAAGLYKTKAKIDAVMEAPRPTNVSELRGFLGMVNYYHKFLPNLAMVLHPLTEMLREDGRSWAWSESCDKAFLEAKQMMTSDCVLTYYDPAKPIRVACDASPYRLGAVLSHQMPDDTERPIAFASRALSKAEKNYSQIDKEALGLIWGIRKFHQYLVVGNLPS